jgi:hypothetical protein
MQREPACQHTRSLDRRQGRREFLRLISGLGLAVARSFTAPTLPQWGWPDVSVAGSDFNYSYRVGGVPEVIRGMGYNPVYRAMNVQERAARYERDFNAMRQIGVNTVVGWVTEEFDDLLLDKAAQFGLGVIFPYDLSPAWDYTNPALRAQIADEVLARTERFKAHPALHMWGLGNEVLLKLVVPPWASTPGDPVLEARGAAFTDFYVGLIDRVRTVDPGHPILYRDAEDAYVARMREAITRDGRPRPWFVYGINIYTPRLAEVIANWPRQGLDIALLISEFGPAGAGPDGRPLGYQQLWSQIRSQPG